MTVLGVAKKQKQKYQYVLLGYKPNSNTLLNKIKKTKYQGDIINTCKTFD